MTLTSPAVGLFRAIVEDPLDDVPRLLLADVLEEAGDPRGEFIRVQCELAKEPPGFVEAVERSCAADGFTCQCRMCSLRRRERELLESASGKSYHCWEWMGETVRAIIPDGAYWHDHVTFRRGLVAEITCTLADWCGAVCPCYWTEQNTDGTCSRCHGTKRTGRHGPALVLAAPIERVDIVSVHDGRGEDMSAINNLLREIREQVNPRSESDLLLAWARQEAGLPGLTS
jgi:uncharacterized protein (TIGR02996 family)